MSNINVLDEVHYHTTIELSQIQDFEYDNSDKHTGVVRVKGRLQKCVGEWKKIIAPKFIIDTIVEGYKIPFIFTPPPFKANNNISALKEKVFVEDAINC